METYGTKAVAKMLGKSPATISKWCREGMFPNADQDESGCPWRIPKEDVVAMAKKKGINNPEEIFHKLGEGEL